MTAEAVATTRDADGQDARTVLREVRFAPLVKRSIARFRDADGLAHARALGYQMVLAILPGLIFFMAFATWTDLDAVRTSVSSVVTALAPGSSGSFLEQAVEQGQRNGRGDVVAMAVGGLAALLSGASGMAQFTRTATRLYGSDTNRPLWRRSALGLALSLSVGLLLGGAFVATAFGATIADAVEGESVWAWLRWPLATVGATAGVTILYKVAPDREQPGLSWLAVGGLVATALWLVFSGGLALYLSASSTFGETYGPLAGLIGLMIWAQLTGLAMTLGMAFTAQLEAERAFLTVP